MHDSPQGRDGSAAEPPEGGLLAWFRAQWRRVVEPPVQLELWDIVAPGALPICPTCTERHHPLAQQCPTCGAAIGAFRAWVYPDMIWMWGRGLWRLMERPSVSRLVWAGMVVLGVGWMSGTRAVSPPFYPELGWLRTPFGSLFIAFSVINVVAGLRLLGKAWRLWRTWSE